MKAKKRATGKQILNAYGDSLKSMNEAKRYEDMSSIQKPDRTREIHEAILNDLGIIALNKERFNIYCMATPVIRLENGTVEHLYNEPTAKILAMIEEQIENRKQEIISFYNR